MYDPRQILELVDAHRWGLLTLCGLSLLSAYVFFISAIVAAHRDRLYSIPLVLTFFWLAHDASVVYRADTWLSYDHWFPVLWWAGLCGTTVIELIFLGQAFRYARAELLPNASPRLFNLLMGGGVLSGFLIWEGVKSVLGDDLYLFAFGLTICVYPPFAVAMLIRRGSSAGQRAIMAGAFTVTALCYFTATAIWFGGGFRSWQWLAMGVFSVLGIAGVALAVHRLRPTPTTVPRPASELVDTVG